MKVKVCGMREPENAAGVAALAPDFMGFIFYPRSPRHCGEMHPSVVEALPEEVTPVAVTVDLGEDEIMSIVERYGFRAVQLHGGEPASLCRRLRERGLTVIKAVSMKDAASLLPFREYEGAADYILLDTPTESKGGSGRKFNWELLEDYTLDIPFLLSGGIGPADAEAVLSLSHPRFAGIDLNSRFELSPALKSLPLLSGFLGQLRKRR